MLPDDNFSCSLVSTVYETVHELLAFNYTRFCMIFPRVIFP